MSLAQVVQVFKVTVSVLHSVLCCDFALDFAKALRESTGCIVRAVVFQSILVCNHLDTCDSLQWIYEFKNLLSLKTKPFNKNYILRKFGAIRYMYEYYICMNIIVQWVGVSGLIFSNKKLNWYIINVMRTFVH